MPCLMALDATLLLRRGRQTRRLPLTQFYTGQKRTVLESGEFIEAVVVPRPRAGEVFRAHKVSKRFEQDISATLFALRYRLVEGRFADVRVACNGLAPAPGRVPLIEAVLEGRAPADVTAAELDAAVAAGFTPRDGLRASWRYRALLARNLVLQFVEDAAGVEETAR
jgi:xanthine dehydrogenase small subunit